MGRPEISIIIPVYNVEAFIRKTIESVIAQSFTSWELILVDDGSPDSSGKICDEYASKYDRITVIHQLNQGVSAARNNGIDKAIGKYICFIDGDDYVDQTYLSSMREALGSHDAAYANVTHCYPEENRTAIAFAYTDGESISLQPAESDKIVQYAIIENGFPVAKLFRLDIIESHHLRFSQELSYHEDHIFVLDYLSKCKSIALTSDASYHYLHFSTASSLSKRNHPAKQLIRAAEILLPMVAEIISEYYITNSKYKRKLFTILGLNQILLAIKNKNAHEISAIGHAVRQHRWQFLSLYSPNHFIARLLPLMFMFHLDRFIKIYVSYASKKLH